FEMTEQEILKYETEQIELLPEPTKTVAKRIMLIKPDLLPEKPEKDKWYVYRPEGCVCSDGTPYYSTLKVGDTKKLLVMFCGGGAALDAYSAARPNELIPKEGETTFYAKNTFVVGYFTGRSGLARSDNPNNPFKDYSVCAISYANGDFHSGARAFEYDDKDKGKGVCYHNGYKNYRAMIEKIKEFVPNPEKIIVTGYSAGGFGTALLTDDVMGVFADCNDVTCIPDSGIFTYTNWEGTFKQWGTPREIVDRVRSDNMPLDCLLDLCKKHGNKVKLALCCSHRDALLTECEAYTNGEGMVFEQKYADKFQSILTETVSSLKAQVPNVALYIFDKPHPEIHDYGMTEHTIVASDWLFDYAMDGVKFIDWVVSATEGKPMQIGLHLLGL
ncbi:MAG: hypothetical protein IKZ28_01170, partial [Clostridia bacterium]|nr:hypothetical protein [Clostridia bacterium]